MGMTYFKRYRMEIDLRGGLFPAPSLPPEYQLVQWHDELLEAHADAKFESFRFEIDADVFPCLGDRAGCVRLMREIARRDGFLREATWLLACHDETDGVPHYCGTIQGVRDGDFGAVQNLGVTSRHRSGGLGTHLLHRALSGFREVGLPRAYLEVTAQNVRAVKLYQRLGFQTVKTVYKAADVAYA